MRAESGSTAHLPDNPTRRSQEMSTSNKREVVVRPVHRDEPDLHKLAEAMIRLVLEESGPRINDASQPLSGLAGHADLDLVAALDEGTVQRIGVTSEQFRHDPPRAPSALSETTVAG